MGNTTRILQNEIKCLKCRDQIYSAHRHDYVTCSCGAVSVDGGMAYLKRSGTDYEDLSVVVSEELYDKLVEALEWSEKTGRNKLGTVCALFRAIRDTGYEIKNKE